MGSLQPGVLLDSIALPKTFIIGIVGINRLNVGCVFLEKAKAVNRHRLGFH